MKETIKSIIEWHETTFPDATLEGQKVKFEKEQKEWFDSDGQDLSELADMFIVACGIARFDSIVALDYFNSIYLSVTYWDPIRNRDLQEAIDKKMEINRQRKWNFENGQYQHKEE